MAPKLRSPGFAIVLFCGIGILTAAAQGQMIDRTQAPNAANEGIAKSLGGADRRRSRRLEHPGFVVVHHRARSVPRDPARPATLSAQVHAESRAGPAVRRRAAATSASTSRSARGCSDSCAGCHGRPRGSAGAGGDVVTRPDSRDAPHLFGLGLKEMLADEMTSEPARSRASGARRGPAHGRAGHEAALASKGVIVRRDHGAARRHRSTRRAWKAWMRICASGRSSRTAARSRSASSWWARFNDEMGLQSASIRTLAAAERRRARSSRRRAWCSTARWIGSKAPPGPIRHRRGSRTETASRTRSRRASSTTSSSTCSTTSSPRPTSTTDATRRGRRRSARSDAPAATCRNSRSSDRRVADVETVYDPERGIFNRLFATATPLFESVTERTRLSAAQATAPQPFVVRNIFTDFKRHDLGPAFPRAQLRRLDAEANS